MDRLLERGGFVAAFAAIYGIWGSTYLAVALGLKSLPPFLLMGARTFVAGVILFSFEQLRRPGLAPTSTCALAVLSGVLLFVGCHGAMAYAQQHVPTGLAAVMLATVPFWIVLINLVVPAGRRPGMASLWGLTPGLIGVALIAWQRGTSGQAAIDPVMVLVLLGSAFSWAAGTVTAQRQGSSTPAIAFASMQLLGGGLVLLAISAAADDWGAVAIGDISWASWGALAYLTIAGSLVAFTAYVWLLDQAPAPLVATYTFVNPIIAVALGWLVLGEQLSWPFLLGFALVVGSVVAVWRMDRPDAHHEGRCPGRRRRAGIARRWGRDLGRRGATSGRPGAAPGSESAGRI